MRPRSTLALAGSLVVMSAAAALRLPQRTAFSCWGSGQEFPGFPDPPPQGYTGPVPDWAGPVIISTLHYSVALDPRMLPQPIQKKPVLRCFVGRNEYEPMALTVFAKQPVAQASARVRALRSAHDGAIPPECIDMRRWSYAWPENYSDQAARVTPRALVQGPVDIPAGCNQQFWIQVWVGPDQAAGLYEGEAEVVSGDQVIARVPVHVRVVDLALPEARIKRGWWYGPVWHSSWRREANRRRQWQYLNKAGAALGFQVRPLRLLPQRLCPRGRGHSHSGRSPGV